MKNFFGITGIRVTTFARANTQVLTDEVNEFLHAHDGDILDIQYSSSTIDSEILVVYKENK